MRTRTRLLLSAGTLLASLRLARDDDPPALDVRVSAALGRPRGSTVDRAVSALTDLGSVYGLTGVVGVLALRDRPRLATDVAVAGSAAWVAAQAAKRLVDRRRPYQAAGAARLVAEPAGTSWPSGHTAVAAAIAAAVRPALAPGARPLATAAGAGVGATRCYVGVHWATDIVAGAAVGEACAAASALVLRRLRR